MELRLLRQHCEYIIATFADFRVDLIATTTRNPLTIYLRLDTITAIDKYRFVIAIFISIIHLYPFLLSIHPFSFILYIPQELLKYRFNLDSMYTTIQKDSDTSLLLTKCIEIC